MNRWEHAAALDDLLDKTSSMPGHFVNPALIVESDRCPECGEVVGEAERVEGVAMHRACLEANDRPVVRVRGRR